MSPLKAHRLTLNALNDRHSGRWVVLLDAHQVLVLPRHVVFRATQDLFRFRQKFFHAIVSATHARSPSIASAERLGDAGGYSRLELKCEGPAHGKQKGPLSGDFDRTHFRPVSWRGTGRAPRSTLP